MTRVVGLLLIGVSLVACRGEQKPAAPKEVAPASPHRDEDEEHEELPVRVALAADVIAAAGIKTTPAATVELPDVIELAGEIVPDPDRSAHIAARVPGRIVEVRVKEGERVKANALIAILESAELAKARAQLTTADAKWRALQRNLERLRSLGDKGLAAGQEIVNVEAEVRALASDVTAARQTLAAFGLTGEDQTTGGARVEIRTPIAGDVLARNGVRGQTVGADFVIASIASLDHAYFIGRLFEKDLARVQIGATAEVRLNAYANELFAGRVERIGKQLDPAARTVVAHIGLDNRADRLKVGLFGRAAVVAADGARRAARVVVARSAVTQIGGKDVVFVQQKDGHFEVHPVALGRGVAGRVEIANGVRPGELVVTDGVFSVKSALLKSTFGEED